MQVRFSETWVRKAPLPTGGKKRVAYQDKDVPRLYLRVTDNSDRTYYAVLWQKKTGKVLWRRIEAVGAIALDDARGMARRLAGEAANGVDLAVDAAIQRAEPTFGELMEGWFVMRTERGDRHVREDREQLYERWLGSLPNAPPRKHGRMRVKPPEAVDWTRLRVSQITQDRIQNLISAIGEHRRISGSVRALLRAAFEWGIRKRQPRLTMSNPAVGVDAAISNKRKRFARTDELPRLLEAIKASPQPWSDLFTVMLFIGYRRSATCSMRWCDIDFTDHQWHIPPGASKGKEPVVLPIEGAAWTVLQRRAKRKEHDVWVFPGATKVGHVGSPKRAWANVLKHANMKDFRQHDLRRTLGSHLGAQGASQATIARALGHRDIRSAAVYTQIDHEPVRQQLKGVHKAFAAAAKRRGK